MTRKTLSWIIGGLGVAMALGLLIGMSLMGSWLADASTESAWGPGVDIHLRTPFPGPQDEIRLEVSARGGSKAGVNRVQVTHEDVTLAEVGGRGQHWGSSIRSGKSRGQDTVVVSFRPPQGVGPGKRLRLKIAVNYTVAMKEGSATFRNKHYDATIPMTIGIYSASERRTAKLWVIARALALLAAWLSLCFGIAYLYWKLDDGSLDPASQSDNEDAEFEGIGLLMGVMGMGLLGYWLFNRPLMSAFSLRSTVWAVLITGGWVVLPVAGAWLWARRLPKYRSFFLHRVRADEEWAGGSPPRPMEPSELRHQVERKLGYTTRERSGALLARRGKVRLRLTWPKPKIEPEELGIRATEIRAVIELALGLTKQFGRLTLETESLSLEIDPERSVEELEAAYTDIMLAEAQRIMESLGEMEKLIQSRLDERRSKDDQ